ncbi:G1/S-specific cyclin pas1 [Choanephora cucurbitarum]|uniref:G1/S-specific cyclin pas1 n=1 Tax=Choanephora cucurbitarum TaxID=101091 RepID=A0A1C7NC64_9FUNG|nr:G1/S-specific cyclin pas1 [Choanephora cucurbitarum]
MTTKDTTQLLRTNDLTQYQKIYVDTLIDITTLTIRTSWPMEASTTKEGQPVVNTNLFVRHLLKRSRATRSTLQLAIFYLFRIRPFICKRSQFDPIVKCGRRMFLASLICAHKYLYDNTFTNASWAKISKLPVKEINGAERALLDMLDYRLHISLELYQKFESQLREAVPSHASIPTSHPLVGQKRSVEQELTTVKRHRQHYHTVYGIPTPEDDKVELV